MNDEIISKSNVGSNIPLADEDAINVDGGAFRLVTSWITSKGLTNAEEDTCSRNVQNFTTFRTSGLSAIARRDLPINKSKSISSIDTQSVNNILDEYEDLDYRRSSDLSDVGNISVTNFEAIMMNQQKRQQVKSKQIKSSGKIQTKSIPTREKIQAVLKVNQQTQVRQRSRDRQKDFNKGHQQDICYVSPPVTMDTIESSRSKMPEILLRKGEVQKRVDEWLNQAHSQNFPAAPREKPLTRSNSSAEKNHRRCRGQDSRSRTSTDEAKDRLNGGTSSSYDDLTRVNRRLERVRPEKVNVGVNTSKGTYKEYLAVRSKQDYGFSTQSNIASSKSGDSNPASRIPQRGLLGSSFKSRRVEANLEEKPTASSRIINLTKAISESDHSRTTINCNSKIIEMSIGTMSMATATTTTSSIISYRRPSLKRSGNGVDGNCAAAAAAHSLAKEEMDPPCERGPTKGLPLLGGSFSDQGEPISPNKDGEIYTTINDSQSQPNEQNAGRSKIAVCENVPSVRITRYASPDHVERIYERSLQPQVIHADDLESILRPSLQTSPYGEKVGVSKDRESTVKEVPLTLEDETGELRHEHLETIEEDDRKSENLVCRYPEVGLKQCLKMQKSLPNGKSKESDKRKENSIYVKWNPQQQIVFNEPARTFATFQSGSSCQDDVKSSIRSRSPEMKESRGHEEITQDPDESTILQDLAGVYEDASREDQNQLTIHSRENSNLSTATIPVDELESQKDSRSKEAEEELSRNKLQFDEKLQERVVEEMTKNADERGAVVNEVLVKNLQFEQDLPENPVEQTKPDHVVQQVNFHNILCDDYENEKLKNKKMYMTKEEMEHQRLIDMLKRGNFETLKTVSDTVIFLN
ncbi:hypothetical protein ALC56_08732 [Trachymyrmex septentrionalis]|uniref:Uncharacterized protein n=1 Tax=Trachymyrmex septentrionalis TaxID=34720 RepID=A0A195F985_9HYME|nr:hypothetical protein ALC56_08732 [Trachymyrmex septentrionalis]